MDKKPIVIVRSTSPSDKDLVFPREFALAVGRFYSITGGLPDQTKEPSDSSKPQDKSSSK